MGQYRDALKTYLAQSGLAGKSSKLDQAAFDASLAKLAPARPPRAFDNLTFYDYVELFLHERTWQHFGPTLQLDRNAVRQLLEGVRSTRNHLAHFRNDSDGAGTVAAALLLELAAEAPAGAAAGRRHAVGRRADRLRPAGHQHSGRGCGRDGRRRRTGLL